MRVSGRILLSALLAVGLAGTAWADCTWSGNTGTVASPYDDSDVQACVTDAAGKTGDVLIQIPAGAATWTTAVSINMTTGWAGVTSLTIQGAGADQTIISAPTASNRYFSLVAVRNVRITGIGFLTTSTTGTAYGIYLSGTCTGVRIDHNTFGADNAGQSFWTSWSVYTNGDVTAVIDSNTFLNVGYGVGINGTGAASWASAMNYGQTAGIVYVEDNVFDWDHTVPLVGSALAANPIDAYSGARYVFRYNTVWNGPIGHHGYEDASRPTGTLQYEIYGNTITYDYTTDGVGGPGWYTSSRGGSGLVYNNYYNKVGGTDAQKGHALRLYRSDPTQSGTYGVGNMCNGNDPDDSNLAVFSGTHTGADSQTVLTSATDHHWTENLYANSYLVNTTDGSRCQITANDGTTATCALGLSGGAANRWHAGDAYELRTGYVCKNQPGRGTNGDLYPVYSFANQNARGWSDVSTQYQRNALMLEKNRDWYSSTDWAGDGSAGVGCGASRPATCTPRVGYWQTAQNCADVSGRVGAAPATPIAGTLYLCTAANTWTAAYTPQTYPHPIRGASPPPPPPPPAPAGSHGVSLQGVGM